MQAKYAHTMFTLRKVSILAAIILTLTGTILYTQKVSASTVVRILWANQNVTNCRVPSGALWNWNGALDSSDGNHFIDIPRSNFTNPGSTNYTFTITCDGQNPDGSATTWTQQANIVVTNPVGSVALSISSVNSNPYAITNFYADSYNVASNQSTIIRWNFSDPNGSCTASGAWSGTKAVSGIFSPPINPDDTQSVSRQYLLNCKTAGGTNAPQAGFDILFGPFIDTSTGGGGNGGCFTEGTMTTLANGTKKNIKDVAPGEYIMSSYGPEQVMKKYAIPYTGKLYAFNGSDNYFVTPTHPFMTTSGWKSFDPQGTVKESPGLDVTLLSVGDTLVQNGGKLVKLEKVDIKEATTTVYNFGINGSHDFYADDYQVHNVNVDVFIPEVVKALRLVK